MIDDKIKKEEYEIEQTTRMGFLLISVFHNNQPKGSLLIDPNEDAILMDEFYKAIERANEGCKQSRDKKERIERNEGRVKKDNRSY